MRQTGKNALLPEITAPNTAIRLFNYNSAIKEAKYRAQRVLAQSQSSPSFKYSLTSTRIHASFNSPRKNENTPTQSKAKTNDSVTISQDDTLAFIYAATRGQDKVISAIEKKGVNIAAIIKENRNILLQVIQKYYRCSKLNPNLDGFKKVISYLANYAESNNDSKLLNAANKKENTGLHFAAFHKDLWLANLLIASGANNNVFNEQGKRPCELLSKDVDKDLQKLLRYNITYLPTLGFKAAKPAKTAVTQSLGTGAESSLQLPTLR